MELRPQSEPGKVMESLAAGRVVPEKEEPPD